ncbi:hypothetical protein KIS4809_3628 [Bacillus sp. ZZV12-4809]|nr:hypothetical protein KIS4809_3628 [Bacillus sp. ZZV12-4809]
MAVDKVFLSLACMSIITGFIGYEVSSRALTPFITASIG